MKADGYFLGFLSYSLLMKFHQTDLNVKKALKQVERLGGVWEKNNSICYQINNEKALFYFIM